MTNKEAIRVLKSTSVNLGRRGGKTAYAEALEMAITALQAQDKLQDIEYMCRLSGGADYFRVFAALLGETNKNEQLNNLNDGVENSNLTQSNEIESKVKGLTACRVLEDDAISRRQAIDIFDDYNVSVENGELEAYSRDRKRLCDLPSAQPLVMHCTDYKDWLERQSIRSSHEVYGRRNGN